MSHLSSVHVCLRFGRSWRVRGSSILQEPLEISKKRSLSSHSSGDDKKTRKGGPVLINQTPRGRVSSQVKIIAEIDNESSIKSGENSESNASKKTSQEVQSPIHFLKGGLPCDPAPPPYRLADYGEESLYTLVLLRHGESEWNSLNRFTGWCDVNLTKKGEAEARSAGRLLHENGIELDHAFTSVLKRASFSCNMALNMAKQQWLPVTKTYRLNERCYGQLQGYNKETAWEELGLDQELVMQMRRSYDVRPPRMENDHPFWHGNDRRYHKLSAIHLEASRTESLKDCADRILPFFNSVIVPSMRVGNKCIIVSHANTLRTLIKHIDKISDDDIKGMSIPTGIPLLYRLDRNLKPVDPRIELEFRYMVEPKGYTWGTSRAHGFHGVYLGDLERLQDIQRKRDATNRDWQRIILRNIAKSIIEEYTVENDSEFRHETQASESPVLEIRTLLLQIHAKLELPDYNNMLLLLKMQDDLKELMCDNKQTFLTLLEYEIILDRLHLDTEGQVVEPFVALSDQEDRERRQRIWNESLVLDLEEDCLIK